ncbi:MAG: DoxX family protein [Candidatus Acidiferrum sp.]
MRSLLRFLFRAPSGPPSILLIRLPVGLIFFTQGILKFTDPHMGVLRFARIGFPHPYFMAHFVGFFEILCGLLVLAGLATRAAGATLLIVITTAIATTKIPELFRATQGFWFMVSDARTDFAMFCSLVFLIAAGAGSWSLDARRIPRNAQGESHE